MHSTEALRRITIQLFMQEALLASLDSDDIQAQTGCCIVDSNDVIIATGCNKLLAGCTKTQDRLERPMKYLYKEVVHADIYQVYDHYFVAYRIYPGTIGATIGFTGRLDYQISARGLDAAKSAVTAIIGERSLIEFRGF